jgi:Fe-S-cluster containining protein
MTPLPVVSCDGCGACCSTVGLPPGFGVFLEPDWGRWYPWAVGSENHRRFLALPSGAMQILASGTADRGPCAFLDEHQRCRFYALRPAACEAFEVGGPFCREFRGVQ